MDEQDDATLRHVAVPSADDIVVSVAPHDAQLAVWRTRDAAARSSIAAGPLLAAVPQLESAFRAGDTVRLVGPQAVLTGLHNGTLRLVETSTGQIGTVADGSGKFAGQVRFRPGDLLTPRVAAGFQLASAVTLQYYLQNILDRLESLSAQVDRVFELLSESAAAEITAAARCCEDLEALLHASGSFSPHDLSRLALAERDISAAYFRDLALSERFMNDVATITEPLDAAVATIGTTHYPKQLRRLKSDLGRLAGEVPVAAQTLERLLLAAEIRGRLLLIRAAGEAGDGTRAAVVTERTIDAIAEMGTELGVLGTGLRALAGLSPDAIDRLFYLEGSVKTALSDYEHRISPLAVPTYELAHAFISVTSPLEVLEVRQGAPGKLDVLALSHGEDS